MTDTVMDAAPSAAPALPLLATRRLPRWTSCGRRRGLDRGGRRHRRGRRPRQPHPVGPDRPRALRRRLVRDHRPGRGPPSGQGPGGHQPRLVQLHPRRRAALLADRDHGRQGREGHRRHLPHPLDEQRADHPARRRRLPRHHRHPGTGRHRHPDRRAAGHPHRDLPGRVRPGPAGQGGHLLRRRHDRRPVDRGRSVHPVGLVRAHRRGPALGHRRRARPGDPDAAGRGPLHRGNAQARPQRSCAKPPWPWASRSGARSSRWSSPPRSAASPPV